MMCKSNSGNIRLGGKNILVDILLLGVCVIILHVAALEEPIMSLWPKGLEIYLGETVLLECRVKSNSTSGWTYQWYRSKPHTASKLNPRHTVFGDSYYITGVTMEDEGSYWCKAELKGSNITKKGRVTLNVSELTPPSISLTPSSRHVFSGKQFTVQCPASKNNSTSWKLRRFSTGNHSQMMLPLRGAVGPSGSEKHVFYADQQSSGLYWCEGSEGRSSSVYITVIYGEMILTIPAFPVSEGNKVVLSCQDKTGNHIEATLFRNGKPINHSKSSWTIVAVAMKDEGFYKCVSHDRKMESPQGWLSVTRRQGNFTSEHGTGSPRNDPWIWIVASCCVALLFLIPLIWLIYRNKYQMFSTRRPLSKESIPVIPPPVTKQDVTEVQWDLSWMEMSNLLDTQLYPGT